MASLHAGMLKSLTEGEVLAGSGRGDAGPPAAIRKDAASSPSVSDRGTGPMVLAIFAVPFLLLIGDVIL